jgi:hypothetical protein
VRDAALLEGEAELLDRLAADERIAPLVLRRLSATRLLLRDAPRAQQGLVGGGEIPTIMDYAAQTGPRFDITPDGTIEVQHHDLLLPIELRRIAEPVDAYRWQISPERVRAAVAALPDGLTGLIKWLRSDSAGVPPEVVTRLRTWALPPDAIGWEQPLLLHLPPDVLAELRTLPELAELLADDYRPSAAVVRVAPEDRDRLVAALRERGIALPPSDE